MANILKHPVSQEIPPKTPPKPNLLITNALMKLFYATVKVIVLSYLINKIYVTEMVRYEKYIISSWKKKLKNNICV